MEITGKVIDAIPHRRVLFIELDEEVNFKFVGQKITIITEDK